jgi:uncharacterized membrane protein YvlD (DUF360 family)
MRTALRTFVFMYIAVRVAQSVIGGFVFSGEKLQTLLLIVVALSALYFFIRPVLAIISLPTHGVGFLFLSFILTTVLLYVLTVFIQDFSLKSSNLSDLIIFGFVLPSKSLTATMSTVFSALVISTVCTFFEWLCHKGK